MDQKIIDLINESRMSGTTIDPEKLIANTARVCLELVSVGIVGSNISLEEASERIKTYFNI